MLTKIYQKKGLTLFLIINLLGVLKPYLGLDLIDPSLVQYSDHSVASEQRTRVDVSSVCVWIFDPCDNTALLTPD